MILMVAARTPAIAGARPRLVLLCSSPTALASLPKWHELHTLACPLLILATSYPLRLPTFGHLSRSAMAAQLE
jgi:hypothetical protein